MVSITASNHPGVGWCEVGLARSLPGHWSPRYTILSVQATRPLSAEDDCSCMVYQCTPHIPCPPHPPSGLTLEEVYHEQTVRLSSEGDECAALALGTGRVRVGARAATG
jgi:hypothetical protein